MNAEFVIRCNQNLWTIDKLQLEPGKDFQVVSISFDFTETPEVAAKWKRNYLHTIKENLIRTIGYSLPEIVCLSIN